MAYSFTVKDKKVLFSNEAVKNLELFELEFVTDAPKLCRLLRKEANHLHDPWRLADTVGADCIRCSMDGTEEPVNFRIRFMNPYNQENDVTIHATVKEW